MKNQYVGDIGDYGKYSLLRFLAREVRIGINWYLTENDGSSDGRFTKYLGIDDEKRFDPDIYTELKRIVDTYRDDRTVQMVQAAGLIPGAAFFGEMLDTDKVSPSERVERRGHWFAASMAALDHAELIFADPDNGITFRKRAGQKGCEKYVLPEEIAKYYCYTGKDVVFYCHKGRRKDDAWARAIAEIKGYVGDARLFVLTYRRGTQRSYIFVVHPEHAARYEAMLAEFISSTLWGECGKFTREYSIESMVNAALDGDAKGRCPQAIPSGFAAPTIGVLHPKGSTLLRNEDGTVTVLSPNTEE